METLEPSTSPLGVRVAVEPMPSDVVLLESSNNWNSPQLVDLILRSMFDDEKTVEEIRKRLNERTPQVTSFSELKELLKRICHEAILFNQPRMNRRGVQWLDKLVAFEDRMVTNNSSHAQAHPAVVNRVRWSQDRSAQSISKSFHSNSLIEQGQPVLLLGPSAETLRSTLVNRGMSPLAPKTIWPTLSNTRCLKEFAERYLKGRSFPKLLVKTDIESGRFFYRDAFRDKTSYATASEYVSDRRQHDDEACAFLKEAAVIVVFLSESRCFRIPGDQGSVETSGQSVFIQAIVEENRISYDENKANLTKFIELVREINPEVEIILGVATEPLKRIGFDEKSHILIENGHDKANLRMAMDAVIENDPKIHYFPIYELSQEQSASQLICDTFAKLYVEPAFKTFSRFAEKMSEPSSMGMVEEKGVLRLDAAGEAYLASLMETGNDQFPHQEFYDACRKVYSLQRGAVPASASDCEMITKGYQVFRGLLNADDVLHLKSLFGIGIAEETMADKENEAKRQKIYSGRLLGKKLSKDICLQPHRLPEFMMTVRKAFRSDLVESLEAGMQSYFRLHHILMTRTFPSSQPTGSFRWHRDYCPKMQAHLMLYLTEAGADLAGGGTEFVARAQTTQIEQNHNYAFVPMHLRVDRLQDANVPRSLTERVDRPLMQPGDGVLFFSNQVLHKGVPPQRDCREVVTLVFHPSLSPWDSFLKAYGYGYLSNRFFGVDTIKTNPNSI